MPPITCPRCQRSNPDIAQFCHFDGIALRGGTAQAAGALAQEFVFPSGKRCRTYDELAAACQDDWAGARDLLRKGAFVQYFSSVGRMDLARAAQEGMAQADPDVGLSNLVSSLPLSNTQGPRLDLNPRRLALGTVLAGETRQVPLTVSNQGQGMLQGTLTVAEGGEWLRIHGSANGQCSLKTPREQQVLLNIDTRGLAAGQTYGARLTVITNGGAVEVPARLDLAAHAFARQPFQGVRSPRELAERMRSQPKAAVPLLESGEIGRWFETNGWNYPVRGTPAKGVAGVQQFFENLGLSKPPSVQLSQTESFHRCKYPDGDRGQITLLTGSKKWVYANVESDAPWLRVLTPAVSGPQQAQIGYEIDVRQAPSSGTAEGTLTVYANGGQRLVLRVKLQVEGIRPSLARRFVQPVLTCTLVFLLTRTLLVPVMDVAGRGLAANAALAHVAKDVPAAERPALMWGGWLKIPWAHAYLNPTPDIVDDLFKDSPADVKERAAAALVGQPERGREFRDHYTSYLLRVVVGLTWWLGAVLGVFILWRRGNVADAPWGLIAGTAAGVVASATVGAAVMVGDLGPQLVWEYTVRSASGGPAMLLVWALVAVGWWTLLGFLTGIALTALGPLGRPFLYPFQSALAGVFRLVGLRRLGEFFAPL
jgi:hypothetical protein